MIVDVARLAGGSVLSGAPSGRQFFTKLVAALPNEPVSPEPFFLDFTAIQVATASFLRESILGFRSFVRGRKSNFYPAVANAATEVIDELFELTNNRGDVVMVCTTDEDGRIIRCLPVGKLDPVQQLTFDLVNKHGETTAGKLINLEDKLVKATAWNNRLASLSNMGLISEQSAGRTKIYRSIFRG